MPRVLVIDDDRIIRKVVEKSLVTLGYDVILTDSGEEGLRAIKSVQPDIVIVDKLMPGIDGLEVTRRLRNEPKFAHLPILVLTGQSDLEDKLSAFEAGADDYLSKPFESAELAARLTALLRRADALKTAQTNKTEAADDAHTIAVHTMRGGIGASSLAVNLAIALRNLWQSTTLLTDMVFSSGQLSLMLNTPTKHTWARLTEMEMDDLDHSSIAGIVGNHECGLHLLAAPANPAEAERINAPLVERALAIARSRYEYVVADLPHDFSNVSLSVLDKADQVLLLLAPEIASVRAAAIALDTYAQLGYEEEKIKLVLNWTFEQGGLSRKKIEATLRHPIALVIPFAPKRFVSAINRGVPLLFEKPADPVSALIEDFAFHISKETNRSIPPAAPSEAWHRVNERQQLFSNHTRKSKSRLLLFA